MTQKDLLKLQNGAVVIHKKSGDAYTFTGTVKVFDGLPPHAANERLCARCERIPSGQVCRPVRLPLLL